MMVSWLTERHLSFPEFGICLSPLVQERKMNLHMTDPAAVNTLLKLFAAFDSFPGSLKIILNYYDMWLCALVGEYKTKAETPYPFLRPRAIDDCAYASFQCLYDGSLTKIFERYLPLLVICTLFSNLFELKTKLKTYINIYFHNLLFFSFQWVINLD